MVILGLAAHHPRRASPSLAAALRQPSRAAAASCSASTSPRSSLFLVGRGRGCRDPVGLRDPQVGHQAEPRASAGSARSSPSSPRSSTGRGRAPRRRPERRQTTVDRPGRSAGTGPRLGGQVTSWPEPVAGRRPSTVTRTVAPVDARTRRARRRWPRDRGRPRPQASPTAASAAPRRARPGRRPPGPGGGRHHRRRRCRARPRRTSARPPGDDEHGRRAPPLVPPPRLTAHSDSSTTATARRPETRSRRAARRTARPGPATRPLTSTVTSPSPVSTRTRLPVGATRSAASDRAASGRRRGPPHGRSRGRRRPTRTCAAPTASSQTSPTVTRDSSGQRQRQLGRGRTRSRAAASPRITRAHPMPSRPETWSNSGSQQLVAEAAGEQLVEQAGEPGPGGRADGVLRGGDAALVCGCADLPTWDLRDRVHLVRPR